MKDGRWGMTSEKPAARCQLRVKERMLLTPPMSVRAVRRLVTEDLGVGRVVLVVFVMVSSRKGMKSN
jgi:hypothetical protein